MSCTAMCILIVTIFWIIAMALLTATWLSKDGRSISEMEKHLLGIKKLDESVKP